MTAKSVRRERAFAWPNGVRAALSLTFDDARQSQLDVAIPILDSFGVRGTFYVSPAEVEPRADDWRKQIASGHEIGNHTMSHPCSANFTWARDNALEDYSLKEIEAEIVAADHMIEKLLGVKPATFAYPCGQKSVGRGEETASYVPIVARRYLAGRGAYDEQPNAPDAFDPAQAFGSDMDHPPLAALVEKIDRAAREGAWLILFAHDVAKPGTPHALGTDVLEGILRHAKAIDGMWIDTVAAVAGHIKRTRG